MSQAPIKAAIVEAGAIANMTHIEGRREAAVEATMGATNSLGRTRRFVARRGGHVFESVTAMLVTESRTSYLRSAYLPVLTTRWLWPAC